MQTVRGVWTVGLVLGIFLLSGIGGCGGSDAEDVAKSLEDRLNDALNIDGAQEEAGAPAEGSDSSEAPQIADWNTPNELKLGEPFAVEVFTTFDKPDVAIKAVIYVKGATNHLHITRELYTLPSGQKRMTLYGVLGVDELLRGKTFELELSLKTEDGVIGLPVPWNLAVKDSDAQPLQNDNLDYLTVFDDEPAEGERPAGSGDAAVPQIDRIVLASEAIHLEQDVWLHLKTFNVDEPDTLDNVLVSAPGTLAYKRSNITYVEPYEDGYSVELGFWFSGEQLLDQRIVLLFALENTSGKSGLWQPFTFEITEKTEPDGDADGDDPDGDSSDGDLIDGDSIDGDSIDGDMVDGDGSDGDADDDADACACEGENECCDGCNIIDDSDGHPCAPGVDPDAWVGVCAEGACVELTATTIEAEIIAGAAISPEDMILSPDDRLLAMIHTNGVYLFDFTGDYTQLRSWGNSNTFFVKGAFSPDGALLATVNNGSSVNLWDTTTGVASSLLRGDTTDLYNVVFSADGQLVYAAGMGTANFMHGWRLRDGGEYFYYTRAGLTNGISQIEPIGLGDKIAAVGTHDFTIANVVNRESSAGGSDSGNGFIDVRASGDGEHLMVGSCSHYSTDVPSHCDQLKLEWFSLPESQVKNSQTFDIAMPVAFDWSPGGGTVAVAYCAQIPTTDTRCSQSEIAFIEPSSWSLQLTSLPLDGEVLRLEYDSTGSRLAALFGDGRVMILQMDNRFTSIFDYNCTPDGSQCQSGEVCNPVTHHCFANPCADTLDNDGDGLPDEADDDCAASWLEVGSDLP